MKHYRVYKLDDVEGRIVKGKDLLAGDDPEAMQQARADEDCPSCEVWEGKKKIGNVDS